MTELGQIHFHTYNGGWGFKIVKQNELDMYSINVYSNSFGDMFTELNLNSGNNQNPLSYKDLDEIGKMFILAAEKIRKEEHK